MSVAAAQRRRVIEDHLPLVRSVARRFAGAEEPLDDLVQVGSIGLIKAVDRFDGSRGTELAPYAAAAIAGEIRHHLRDRCAPVRVPRRLQAEGLHVRPVPLEGSGDDARASDPTAELPERVALAAALRSLPPRQRRIVHLHFFADLSQAQVAAAVGLSQVHVSRLLSEALAALRSQLAPAPTNGQGPAVAAARQHP
jgi:RNA polymerase sigma-B factor